MIHLRLRPAERRCSRGQTETAQPLKLAETEQARGWRRKLAPEQSCHSVPEAGVSGIPLQTACFRTCLLTFKITIVLTIYFSKLLLMSNPAWGSSMSFPALLTCLHRPLSQRHRCHGQSLHAALHSASTPITQGHGDRGPCSSFTSFAVNDTDKGAPCRQ